MQHATHALATDLDDLTHSLASAFHDDPVSVWMFAAVGWLVAMGLTALTATELEFFLFEKSFDEILAGFEHQIGHLHEAVDAAGSGAPGEQL